MRRTLPAVVLLALAAGTAACTSSGAPAADATPSPSPSASASPNGTDAPAATTTAPVSGSQCSVSDYGLASSHTAWATLILNGKGFDDWESATASYLDTARSAAKFDATFAGVDAQDAIDARALVSALEQVDGDFQQGVSTGTAAATYKTDAEAAQNAAALFDGCTH